MTTKASFEPVNYPKAPFLLSVHSKTRLTLNYCSYTSVIARFSTQSCRMILFNLSQLFCECHFTFSIKMYELHVWRWRWDVNFFCIWFWNCFHACSPFSSFGAHFEFKNYVKELFGIAEFVCRCFTLRWNCVYMYRAINVRNLFLCHFLS